MTEEASGNVLDDIEERLRLLADAGLILNSTLDYDQTIQNLAHLIVPRFADWCAIDIVGDDDEVVRFAVAVGDSALAGEAAVARDVGALKTDVTTGSVEVIRSGESIFLPTVDEAALEQAIAEPVTRAIYQSLGPTSLLIVPIAAKGLICGAIQCVNFTPGAHFNASDLLLAEDLGRRTGLAVDNARHYEGARETAERLREANSAKDEFLGMVSHELRTPITVIYGGARVLRRHGVELDADTHDELVADIEREARRLGQMVENLLTLSRTAAGRQPIELEPVLLQRQVPTMLQDFTEARSRNIRVDADPDTPPAAAHQAYLELVLRNLVGNAAKYSPPDSPIVVEVAADDASCRVAVADDGPGVPQGEEERIFERFYRAPGVATGTPGAGLGLAVSRMLVDAMEGSISVTSASGGGARFVVRLGAYCDDGDDE